MTTPSTAERLNALAARASIIWNPRVNDTLTGTITEINQETGLIAIETQRGGRVHVWACLVRDAIMRQHYEQRLSPINRDLRGIEGGLISITLLTRSTFPKKWPKRWSLCKLRGQKMSSQEPVIIDNATGEIEHLPPQRGKRYRCQLNSLADVKAEMAKVYRETRSDLIDPQTATKLTWCLQAIGKVIETSDLEARISALEEKQS